MGIENQRKFLTTVDVDVLTSAGHHTFESVMDVISEDLSKISTERRELGVLTGLIMLILQAVSSKSSSGNHLVWQKSGRLSMNWPDMMVKEGRLSYTFAGRQTIADLSVRYRFTFKGEPTRGSSVFIHQFLEIPHLREFRKLLSRNNILYCKETGLWSIKP